MAVYRPTYRDANTGKMKERPVWWYEFVYAGQRIRESAKTTRKTIAVEAEKQRRLALERARAGLPAEDLKTRIQTVRRALAAYKKTYPVNHRPKSVQLVKERSVHLERLLGALLPQDLSEDRVKQYMADRKAEGASNRTVNMEVDILARAIGQRFQMLWPKLKKLEEQHDLGRALSFDEEQRLIEAAAKNRSRMIAPIVRLALTTGMRSDEIRLLKWSQIEFEKKQITVGRAKTAAGQGRMIPMQPILEAVITGYASWYVGKLGALESDWFVFPQSNRTKPVDPTQPLTSFKTAWESVRDTADVQCRFHDLRHTVCTKMAEAGVPESTMKAIMGHMSREMLERYSHIRIAEKVKAMAAVESRSAFSVGVPTDSPTVSDAAVAKSSVTH